MDKKQVIVYVDGYNFYYGLKNGGAKWKRKDRGVFDFLTIYRNKNIICPMTN